MSTKAPRVKWVNKNGLEKATIVVNYLVGIILVYYGLMRASKGMIIMSSVKCPECVFQLLVGLAFILMATSDLLDV